MQQAGRSVDVNPSHGFVQFPVHTRSEFHPGLKSIFPSEISVLWLCLNSLLFMHLSPKHVTTTFYYYYVISECLATQLSAWSMRKKRTKCQLFLSLLLNISCKRSIGGAVTPIHTHTHTHTHTQREIPFCSPHNVSPSYSVGSDKEQSHSRRPSAPC